MTEPELNKKIFDIIEDFVKKNNSRGGLVYTDTVLSLEDELTKMAVAVMAEQKRLILEEGDKMEIPRNCPEYPNGNGWCNQKSCSWCGSFLRKSDEAQDGYNQALTDYQDRIKNI